MFSQKVLALLAMAGGLSASALAQPQPPAQPEPPEKALRGGFDRPLNRNARAGARPEQDARGGRSTMSMTQSNGKDTVSVHIEDDEVTAEVNGKSVPKERIRRHDDAIDILDERGEVIHTLNVAIGGNGEMQLFNLGGGDQPPAPPVPNGPPRDGGRAGRGAGGDGGQPGNRWDVAPRSGNRDARPPRVMMGITMSDADPRVVVGGGILLDSVVDGLGAAKAGLQKDDLIVEIEGARPVSQEKLRELLRGKKPGDELKLKYTRQGGKETEAAIALEAFDAKKLGMSDTTPRIAVQGNPLSAFRFGGVDHDELHKILSGAIGDLRNKAEDTKELREKIARQLEKALEQIEVQRKQVEELFGQFSDNMANREWPRIGVVGPDGRGGGPDGRQMIIRPFAPGEHPEAQGGNDPFAGAADKLSEKLDRLNKRLDELEKRLNDKK
ncbi:MAG: PDZ domain-containing protein [Planctomycetota bacterium]